MRGLLEPLSWRRGAPAHAPLIAAPLLEPLARAHVQIAVQLGGGLLPVDEVAEAAAHAALAAVEAAARLAEVGHGGQLAVDGAPRVPAAVERVAGFLRVLFVLEAHVDVADEIWGWVSTCFGHLYLGYQLTIVVVVAHDQLLDQPVLAQLAPDVLVEGVEVMLHLLRVHLVLGVVRRVLVQVGQENRLRVRRLHMLSRAAVAVAAGADLVVEGAVDLVLLRSEDGGEVVRHFCGVVVCVGGAWGWLRGR